MNNSKPNSQLAFDRCLRVVAMNADDARAFFGFGDEVVAVDGGAPESDPLRPNQHKPGARVWLVFPDDKRRIELVRS
jgi:hypothetical protein